MEYSTDSAEPHKFRPHGLVEFAMPEEGIIYYRAHGPFNKELITSLESLEKDVLQEIKRKWGIWTEIVTFEGSCMMSDELLNVYGAHLKQLAEHGIAPIASAYVFAGVEGSRIMNRSYQRIYDHAEITYQEFNDVQLAVDWLKQELAVARQD